MAFTKDTTLEAVHIRERLDEWLQAFQAKDLDRIMGFYAEDVLAFDLMPPLKHQGKEAYRNLWKEGFSQMVGPFSFEFKEQHISADEDLAYAFHLCRFRGKDPDGQEIDIWSRVTDCFRKIDGQWLITHEHTSLPVDMKSGKGVMDLKP